MTPLQYLLLKRQLLQVEYDACGDYNMNTDMIIRTQVLSKVLKELDEMIEKEIILEKNKQ